MLPFAGAGERSKGPRMQAGKVLVAQLRRFPGVAYTPPLPFKCLQTRQTSATYGNFICCSFLSSSRFEFAVFFCFPVRSFVLFAGKKDKECRSKFTQ